MVDTFVSTSLYQRSPLDILSRQSSGKIASPDGFFTPSSSKFVIRHGDATTVTPHSPPSPLLHTRFKAHSGSSTAASSFLDYREDYSADSVGRAITKPSRKDDDVWSRDEDDSIHYDTSYDSQTLTYPTPGFQYIIDAMKNKSADPPSPIPSSPGIVPDEQRLSYMSAASAYTVKDEHPHNNSDSYLDAANGVNSTDQSIVPQVIVSSPPPSVRGSFNTDRPSIDGSSQSAPLRAPTQYSVSNFSRPRRLFNQGDEQRKFEVLERNRARSPTQTSADSRSGTPTGHTQLTHLNGVSHQTSAPFNHGATSTFEMSPPVQLQSQSPTSTRPISPNGLFVPASLQPGQRSATPTGRHSQSRSPSPSPANVITNISSAQPTPDAQSKEQRAESNYIRLPNLPPSPRVTSRVSLYSTYSYYQLDDSRTPSPSTPGPTSTEFGVIMNNRTAPPSNNTGRATPGSQAPTPMPATPGPPAAEEYLVLGIQHHEANRLQDSAACFERAATLDGGCGVGMLMWGLTLRHAWGVAKDEKAAFIWLRRAAESAVEDLEAAREGKEQVAVKVCCRLYGFLI